MNTQSSPVAAVIGGQRLILGAARRRQALRAPSAHRQEGLGVPAVEERAQRDAGGRRQRGLHGAQRGEPRRGDPGPRGGDRRDRQRRRDQDQGAVALEPARVGLPVAARPRRQALRGRQLGEPLGARRQDRREAVGAQPRHRRQGLAGVGRRRPLRHRGERPLPIVRPSEEGATILVAAPARHARGPLRGDLRLAGDRLRARLLHDRGRPLLPGRQERAVQGDQDRADLARRRGCGRRTGGDAAGDARRGDARSGRPAPSSRSPPSTPRAAASPAPPAR